VRKKTALLILLLLLINQAPLRAQDDFGGGASESGGGGGGDSFGSEGGGGDGFSTGGGDSFGTGGDGAAGGDNEGVIGESFSVDGESSSDSKSSSDEMSTDTVDVDSMDGVKEKTKTPNDEKDASSKQAKTNSKDDLESLKSDTGKSATPINDSKGWSLSVDGRPEEKVEEKADEIVEEKKEEKIVETKEQKVELKPEEPAVFDVGQEEHELMALAQNFQGQISDTEWNEVATAAKIDAYTVVQNDWLFKISKRLFGTGFYYPKIWSLNSFITNPHFIEPGMVLSFTTGSGASAPEVKLGSFTSEELMAVPGSSAPVDGSELSNFGDDAKPEWMDEKDKLSKQGVYFQYSSNDTMDDLVKAGEKTLNKEYEHYSPPRGEYDVIVPGKYDKLGFDKTSRIYYSVKEGFYLSTFVSTNIVQDFGSIVNGPDENIYFTKLDHAFVEFDESIKVMPGDLFSVYTSGGKVKHSNSDREGYKYSIVGQIKLMRKIKNKWEVEFVEVSGTPQRGDRITAYTPKIERITKTYNSRLVEAAILSTYQPNQTLLAFGDVIYLDRGRADGLEMGNVLEVFGFKDRFTKRNITDQPTYKTGEVTVITLTDNFATVLITKTLRDFYAGDIAITKTKESFLREMKARNTRSVDQKAMMGGKALDELDVELNLENLNDDLLKEADKIQLTEDELAELDRQEREKSVIKDSERDLKALERLESEIEQAESILSEAKLDEDKLLEGQNLNDVEKSRGAIDQDSLDEIEENLGKRYMDEDINSKENPFGLSEFDIEEIDELLNTEKGNK
jgi:hypothetical protein